MHGKRRKKTVFDNKLHNEVATSLNQQQSDIYTVFPNIIETTIIIIQPSRVYCTSYSFQLANNLDSIHKFEDTIVSILSVFLFFQDFQR